MPDPTTNPTSASAAASGAANGALVDLGVLSCALGWGAGLVALLLGSAWLLGLLPAGLENFVALGALAAVASVAFAIVLHSRFLDRRFAQRHPAFANDPRLMSGRIQSLLAAAFAIKLLVLLAGVFGLRQAGVKFEATVAFAVAFAAAALACQFAAAAYLSRVLGARRSSSNPPR